MKIMNTVSKYKKGAVKAIAILFTFHFSLFASVLLTSCADYLEIVPENNIPLTKFWQSKSDVESSLSAGYYRLRESVENTLLPWGEHRAGVIYYTGGGVLQNYDNLTAKQNITKWDGMYKIIKQANLVLSHAESVRSNDRTYTQEEVNSHKCEAYFLRSLAYFYLVRNFRDVPLIDETMTYETDADKLQIAKSDEKTILARLEKDLEEAVKLGAAKSKWDTTWETKGKATCWSIYALLADIYLWDHKYQEAIDYCNKILEGGNDAPYLLTSHQRSAWFSMFSIGNSDESIFEIQWSNAMTSNNSPQTNGLFALFAESSANQYYLTKQAALDMYDEWMETREYFTKHQKELGVQTYDETLYGRTSKGTVKGITSQTASKTYLWKYCGDQNSADNPRTVYDNNFIIYRVADVYLTMAEALVMQAYTGGSNDFTKAMWYVNQVRNRTNLENVTAQDTKNAIDLVIHERIMEFVAEGKAWYDLLRLGRYGEAYGDKLTFNIKEWVHKYFNAEGRVTEKKVDSYLNNSNKWYLPINNSELNANKALVQNPAY